MSNFRLVLLFISIAFLSTSCDNKKEERLMFEKLSLALPKVGIEKMGGKVKVILTVNMRGCSVCYSRALYFLEHNIDKEEVLYVITGISSKKNLRIRLGSDIVDHERVFLDSNNYLFAMGVVEPYPIIVYLNEDGGLGNLEIADLNYSEAYSNLTNFLIEDN